MADEKDVQPTGGARAREPDTSGTKTRQGRTGKERFAMSAIRNIPIGRKFTISFGLVCSLCIGLGVYTFFTLRAITQKSTDVSDSSLPSIVYLVQMRGS
jgi:hypothetical protein